MNHEVPQPTTATRSPGRGRPSAVAAGVAATVSLRSGGSPVAVPELDPGLVGYFAAHQDPGARPQL
jgi:hypothetical protein